MRADGSTFDAQGESLHERLSDLASANLEHSTEGRTGDAHAAGGLGVIEPLEIGEAHGFELIETEDDDLFRGALLRFESRARRLANDFAATRRSSHDSVIEHMPKSVQVYFEHMLTGAEISASVEPGLISREILSRVTSFLHSLMTSGWSSVRRLDLEPKRNFVVIGHGVDPSGDFGLDDLCGGAAGRLDVLLRCVSSALFLSHGLRRNVEVFLVFPRGPKTVRFCAAQLRCANPDERSTGALVRKALKVPLDEPAEYPSNSGVYVSTRGFEATISALPNPVLLVEDGAAWPPTMDRDVTFILSDHRELLAEEQDALARLNAQRVSLGPRSLHSSHCITVAHYLMDSRA